MTNLPVKRDITTLAPSALRHLEIAAELAAADISEATAKAYQSDFNQWAEYAEEEGFETFPVSVAGLLAYIGFMRGDTRKKVDVGVSKRPVYSLSTVRRRCAAIAYFHKIYRGEDGEYHTSPTVHPEVERTLRGYARTQKRKRTDKKTALTAGLVAQVVRHIDDSLLKGKPTHEFRLRRDRTILLVGFMTGMRRSELAALGWGDVEYRKEGVIITIPFSKTDQLKEGQQVGIPKIGGSLCAAEALQEWENYLNTTELAEYASVFHCSGKAINRAVQRYMKMVLDGDAYLDYGAHSFRSGFVTESHRGGAKLEDIMAQTRHKSRDVAQGYVQATELLQNEAVRILARRLQET